MTNFASRVFCVATLALLAATWAAAADPAADKKSSVGELPKAADGRVLNLDFE